jgi:hypothetical protein
MGSCSTHGGDVKFVQNLVRKSGGKRPFGRRKCRREDNGKKYLRKTGWENVDWMDLVQDRDQWWAVVNRVMNLRVS